MPVRPCEEKDAGRIAEIYVYNWRANFFPIFRDEPYYFGELQVTEVAQAYLRGDGEWKSVFVYDDGVVKGFVQAADGEIKKLYVDSFFQNEGIGGVLIEYALAHRQARFLWALEENEGAIRFYERHGFHKTPTYVFEEGTTHRLVRMER